MPLPTTDSLASWCYARGPSTTTIITPTAPAPLLAHVFVASPTETHLRMHHDEVNRLVQYLEKSISNRLKASIVAKIDATYTFEKYQRFRNIKRFPSAKPLPDEIASCMHACCQPSSTWQDVQQQHDSAQQVPEQTKLAFAEAKLNERLPFDAQSDLMNSYSSPLDSSRKATRDHSDSTYNALNREVDFFNSSVRGAVREFDTALAVSNEQIDPFNATDDSKTILQNTFLDDQYFCASSYLDVDMLQQTIQV